MNTLKTRLAAVAFVVLAAAGIVPSAQAAPFVYIAPCLANCAALGIADGANIAGIFDINDAAALPNAVVDQTDMTSAAIFAGNLIFTLPDFSILAIALDPTGNAAIGWLMLAQNAGGEFAAVNDGTTNLFAAAPPNSDPALGGPGALFRVVPEPTSLALLASGLLLAGWSRRKAER